MGSDYLNALAHEACKKLTVTVLQNATTVSTTSHALGGNNNLFYRYSILSHAGTSQPTSTMRHTLTCEFELAKKNANE